MQGRATQEEVMMNAPVFVGIDVSQAQLDIALRPAGHFTAPHDDAGIAKVVDQLRTVTPTVVLLEATGGLELPLVGALAAAALPVVVVNPRQVRDFCQGDGAPRQNGCAGCADPRALRRGHAASPAAPAR